MSSNKKLTGMVIGRLTVIKESTFTKPASSGGTMYYWECQCSCADKNIVTVWEYSLLSKNHPTQSCGCLQKESMAIRNKSKIAQSGPSKDLTGQKFGRLTVIKLSDKKLEYNGKFRYFWDCLCECGNIKAVAGGKLQRKEYPTRSCGCLQKETAGDQFRAINKAYDEVRPHPFHMQMAYIYIEKHGSGGSYNDGDISIEKFKELSQLPCDYCGVIRDNARKITTTDATSRYTEEDLIARYNGLDRLNNSRKHDLDNVVPACGTCNMRKSNHHTNVFWELIVNIKNNFTMPNMTLLSDSDAKIKMINESWYHQKTHRGEKIRTNKCQALYKTWHTSYRDGLSLQQFFQLYNRNCSYCGKEPSSYATYLNDDSIAQKLLYTGLDRINNDIDHRLENIIPCCTACNWLKLEMNIFQFLEWVALVYPNRPKD